MYDKLCSVRECEHNSLFGTFICLSGVDLNYSF